MVFIFCVRWCTYIILKRKKFASPFLLYPNPHWFSNRRLLRSCAPRQRPLSGRKQLRISNNDYDHSD